MCMHTISSTPALLKIPNQKQGACVDTNMLVRDSGQKRAKQLLNAHTHTHAHTHMHTRIYTQKYTHIHTYTCTYTHIHPQQQQHWSKHSCNTFPHVDIRIVVCTDTDTPVVFCVRIHWCNTRIASNILSRMLLVVLNSLESVCSRYGALPAVTRGVGHYGGGRCVFGSYEVFNRCVSVLPGLVTR